VLDHALLEILVCPRCRADLRLVDPDGAVPPGGDAGADKPGAPAADGGTTPTVPTSAPSTVELVCTGADCGLAYPVRDDIPVLLIDEARRPDRSP